MAAKRTATADVPGQLFFELEEPTVTAIAAPQKQGDPTEIAILAALEAGQNAKAAVLEAVNAAIGMPKSFIGFVWDRLVRSGAIEKSKAGWVRIVPEPPPDHTARNTAAKVRLAELVRQNLTKAEIDDALFEEFDFEAREQIGTIWTALAAERAEALR